MGRRQGFMPSQRLKLVRGAGEGQLQPLRKPGRHRFAEARWCIEPGAHRRAADRQLQHLGEACVQRL